MNRIRAPQSPIPRTRTVAADAVPRNLTRGETFFIGVRRAQYVGGALFHVGPSVVRPWITKSTARRGGARHTATRAPRETATRPTAESRLETSDRPTRRERDPREGRRRRARRGRANDRDDGDVYGVDDDVVDGDDDARGARTSGREKCGAGCGCAERRARGGASGA